jgi:O-antigen ligase
LYFALQIIDGFQKFKIPNMKTKKAVKSTTPEDTTVIISRILFILYLLTGFVPLMGAMDYDAPEWLYVSLLNIVSLIFIYKNKDELHAFLFPKEVKLYLVLFAGFFVVGCLSMLNAINVSESLVHLARLFNSIVAFYCLYIFIKQKPKEFFNFICKIAIVIVVYFTWKAVRYFIGNYDQPRTHDLIFAFQHNFSSVNIYTAYIVVQLPLVIYGFLYFKSFWKYIAAVATFMSIFALFIVGSRTALLTFVVLFFVLIAYLIYGIVKHKMNFKKEAIVLVMLPVLTLLLALNINRLSTTSMNSFDNIVNTKSNDYNKGKRMLDRNIDNATELMPEKDGIVINKTGGDSGRFSLWNLAFTNFKENPVLGIGYGNYKAVGKKQHYKNYVASKGQFANPRRAHSDFMEKLAETGLIGFLLYVSLFAIPFILFIRAFTREKEYANQFILVIVFLSALAYTFDALLNFPLERAPIHIYFLLTVAFMLILAKKEAENKTVANASKRSMVVFGIVFLTSFASVASNYVVLKSYQLQRSMRDDLSGKTLFTDQKLNNSYQSIQKKWSNYPQLSYVGTVNNVFLANYAIKAKKYEDALEILNRSKDYTKDAFLVKAFKSEIYLNVYDNLDSAKYYSEDIFDGYPAFKTNYNILKKIYRKEKDTVNLFRVMDHYTNTNYRDTNEWIAKANMVYEYTANSKRMLRILDTAMVYNPSSAKLIEAKKEILGKLKFKSYLSNDEVRAKHQIAYDFFVKQQYPQARKVFEEILKTNPTDYLSIQNIGIIDLVNKNYLDAVKNLSKVIDAQAFSDGKAEYSRGYCYEQLGNLEKAKEDYKASRLKNYPQAMSLPESKYE